MDGSFRIENGVLYYCASDEEELVIPDTAEEIGPFAFMNKNRLKRVVIPDSVKKIGVGAFRGCASLTEIRIPDSVRVVDDTAFMWCSMLKRVSIPASLEYMGEGVFARCFFLQELILPKNTARFSGTALELVWNRTYRGGLKAVTAVSFVRELPVSVLRDPAVRYKLIRYRNSVFYGALESDDAETVAKLFSLYKRLPLEILDGYISAAADSPCCKSFLLDYKMRSYTPQQIRNEEKRRTDREFGEFRPTLSEYKRIFSLKKREEGYVVTSYKGKDTCVTVPSVIGRYKVTAIGNYAFSPNKKGLSPDAESLRRSIESVSLPYGITDIGKGAFSNCASLKEMVLPDTVTRIGEKAFYLCESLKSVDVSGCSLDIGFKAFDGCIDLESVRTCGSVMNIGSYAFNFCPSLKNIDLSAASRIGRRAFRMCGVLDTVDLSRTEYLGKHAFGSFSSPGRLILPKDVTEFKGSMLERIWDEMNNTISKGVMSVSFIKQLSDQLLYSSPLKTRLKKNKTSVMFRALASDDAELIRRFFTLFKRIPAAELENYISTAESVGAPCCKEFLLEYGGRYIRRRIGSVESSGRRQEPAVDFYLKERKGGAEDES